MVINFANPTGLEDVGVCVSLSEGVRVCVEGLKVLCNMCLHVCGCVSSDV